MLIVGYAIYASTSFYNANKKKEVSKSNNWLRCIVTGLVLIGIVAGYLLFAAQLAIWSGVVSIIVLLGFVVAFYLQDNYLKANNFE